ncbi:MAG: chloride channel protein [Flavobacteriales bacterium]|nr:chloride channel protein [Flavobacteriales bacterium]MBK7943649.1 chloride channel protein [Flavobacteriales bacterium]MBK9699667.1 chloride channel protein [Flavobacteriales bacterium]
MPPTPPPAPSRLIERLQRQVTSALAWLGRKVMNSRMKELTLLTLPYQVAAVITALIAVGYAKLFGLVEEVHAWVIGLHPDWIFVSAPLAFLLSWWLVRRFAPMAGGSGIPQLMAAIEVANDKATDRSWRFLNVRIILVKIASSLAMVVGGGAVGREGPTLQIAGSVYRTVHKLLPPFWPQVSRKVMMVTGGAAGLSAAFNTPLGGIVFAVEELTRTHIAQFRTAVLTAVILAGMTAQLLLGPYLFLGYPKLEPVGFSFMYKVLAIGLCAGAAGALFCKAVLLLDKWRRTLKGNIAQAFFAVGCALAFAVTVKLTGTFALGSGKHLLESYLFDATVDPGWRDIAARILGPLFSFSAGGAGGIFAPSLASGAAVGGWIAQWFEPSRGEFNVLVLAGMTAFLTGVSRSPFTSAILVLEMTDRHSVIFQLMYAAMVAYLISHGIDKRSYYERMKLRLLAALPGNSGREPVGDRPARNGSKRPPEHDPHDEEPPSPTPGYGLG